MHALDDGAGADVVDAVSEGETHALFAQNKFH